MTLVAFLQWFLTWTIVLDGLHIFILNSTNSINQCINWRVCVIWLIQISTLSKFIPFYYPKLKGPIDTLFPQQASNSFPSMYIIYDFIKIPCWNNVTKISFLLFNLILLPNTFYYSLRSNTLSRTTQVERQRSSICLYLSLSLFPLIISICLRK